MTAEPQPVDVDAARRALGELRQLERELVELRQLRRLDALERVRDAIRRISEVGTPEGILDRAAEELGAGSEFDRVLISRVSDGALVPHAIWVRDDRAGAEALRRQLTQTSVRLEYPLVEHDVAQRQRAAIVADVSASGRRTPQQLAAALAWDGYVVAALTLRGSTVGLLHADASASRRPLDALDEEVASIYAEGLAGAFERAALRKTLQRHREELRVAVQWMSDAPRSGAAEAAGAAPPGDPRAEALTARETDVVRLLARGQTNLAIAKTLVISEGTVKYHVKNILRKLHATSRADAVARYLRSGR